MWKAGASSGSNPFRRALNDVTACGLCPPVNVQDGEGCKRPSQSDVPAWKAARSCLEQINTVNRKASSFGCWVRWRGAGRQDVHFLCSSTGSFVATWLIYYIFQYGGRRSLQEELWKNMDFHADHHTEGHSSRRGKKLIWACSNPRIRLPFSTKVAAPRLHLSPAETKWTWANWTGLTPDRSIPMGVQCG